MHWISAEVSRLMQGSLADVQLTIAGPRLSDSNWNSRGIEVVLVDSSGLTGKQLSIWNADVQRLQGLRGWYAQVALCFHATPAFQGFLTQILPGFTDQTCSTTVSGYHAQRRGHRPRIPGTAATGAGAPILADFSAGRLDDVCFQSLGYAGFQNHPKP